MRPLTYAAGRLRMKTKQYRCLATTLILNSGKLHKPIFLCLQRIFKLLFNCGALPTPTYPWLLNYNSKATQMSQRCLSSGKWDVVDFTTCTLQSTVKTPFMMVWSSLLDGVALEQQVWQQLVYTCINFHLATYRVS